MVKTVVKLRTRSMNRKLIFVFLLATLVNGCVFDRNKTSEVHNTSSYNQSGGITAHTVNFKRSDRHLTEEFKADLLSKLPREKVPITLRALTQPEPLTFAKEIEKILKEEGWEVQFIKIMMSSNPHIGQTMRLKDGKMEITIWNQE